MNYYFYYYVNRQLPLVGWVWNKTNVQIGLIFLSHRKQRLWQWGRGSLPYFWADRSLYCFSWQYNIIRCLFCFAHSVCPKIQTKAPSGHLALECEITAFSTLKNESSHAMIKIFFFSFTEIETLKQNDDLVKQRNAIEPQWRSCSKPSRSVGKGSHLTVLKARYSLI